MIAAVPSDTPSASWIGNSSGGIVKRSKLDRKTAERRRAWGVSAAGRRLTLRTFPAPGQLDVGATTSGGARTLTFASVKRRVAAGTTTVALKPTKAARRLLTRKRKLKLKIRAAFTPGAGGQPAIFSRALTVKAGR
jgi:hypothetical protein